MYVLDELLFCMMLYEEPFWWYPKLEILKMDTELVTIHIVGFMGTVLKQELNKRLYQHI